MSQRAKELLSIGLHPLATDSEGLPLLAASASGAFLLDHSGKRYVDWVMGMGSMLLGYDHPEVTEAIRSQLDAGTLFSIPHSLEIDVAERLVAQVPCADRVAFGKNGSDVCMAAVRLARAITRREGILHFGYHGFHDWSVAVNPKAEGFPASLRELVHTFEYNDLEALHEIFEEHGHSIAALIMEPMRLDFPCAGFLEGVRQLTQEHGTILIFDEVVTGFRLGPGGAQEMFQVTPDLACLGKSLSNGMALSALVGRAHLMDELGRIAYGMTARGESLALSAARTVLDLHSRDATADCARHAGETLRRAFDESCKKHGVKGGLKGHPAMMTLDLPDGWLEPFLAGCRAKGVLCYSHLLPSSAHTEEAIEITVEVFDHVLEMCARDSSRR